MHATDRIPHDWSRRSLLVALAAGSVTVLAGCRVRLEDDAPRIPGLPTRDPIPDEQALLSARWDALELKRIADGLGDSSTALTRRVAALHGQQVSVLEAVLRSGGVPLPEITATPPTPTAAATPSSVKGLIAAEAEALSAKTLAALAGLSTDRVALLGSMAAQRATVVRLLGGRVPQIEAATRTATGPTGDFAAAQLAAVRSAVYGFEVVEAQTDTAHRQAAAATLARLRSSAARLERLAGGSAPPMPLGFALPFRVSTPAGAMKLATHVLSALREAVAGQLPAGTGDAAALSGTVRLLTDVTVDGVTWRVPLTAFPGLIDT